MARTASGRVTTEIKRETLGVQVPVAVARRFRRQAAEVNLPNGAYLTMLVDQAEDSPLLETRADYMKAIHQYSSLAASLAGAAALKFGVDGGQDNEEEVPDAA